MEIPALFSNHSSGSIRPETKSGSIAPTDGFSNGGSPSDVFNKLKCHKSDRKRESSRIVRSDLRVNSGNLLIWPRRPADPRQAILPLRQSFPGSR
ncbi:hypothetical protein E2562_001656 [Oryza meyeriana var. granulata]|uniref:Uncharacterized protein n=1 Tax=Oryza meyeriana var. granulata TaxID=110450 RepID=A0A6G1CCR2_9ORYZ|nr:hypothetical protein E2562_001656 [Oryza meyeriana var. granulata]